MKDLKKCTKCGIEKPATAKHWYRNKNTNDGLQAQCKKCMSAYQKEHSKEHKKGRVRSVPQRLGIDRDKIEGRNYKKGQVYEVKQKERNRIKTRKGKLIQETDDFIVLKSKSGITESFLKKDLFIDTEIKEVAR